MGARAAMAIFLGAAIALAGWRRAALSGPGAVAAAIIGSATFSLGGMPGAAALVAFFLSGSWLSRRPSVPGEVAPSKGHRRDALQVLANGGVATGAATGVALGARVAKGGLVGALAAAAADTWASEVGVRSPKPPRSITTGRVVRPGTSGGVTALGFVASSLGALFIGFVYVAAERGLSGWRTPLLSALIGGTLGSIVDSCAGATIQAAYRCTACGLPSETSVHACGGSTSLIRGWRWVTNDAVNLLGTLAGAVVGTLLWDESHRRPL